MNLFAQARAEHAAFVVDLALQKLDLATHFVGGFLALLADGGLERIQLFLHQTIEHGDVDAPNNVALCCNRGVGWLEHNGCPDRLALLGVNLTLQPLGDLHQRFGVILQLFVKFLVGGIQGLLQFKQLLQHLAAGAVFLRTHLTFQLARAFLMIVL